jgi:hypothetical protein
MKAYNSRLDLFGRIYNQTGSFQDHDGNVYLVFERRRFKIFRERVILRRELLEEAPLHPETHTLHLYPPTLRSPLRPSTSQNSRIS